MKSFRTFAAVLFVLASLTLSSAASSKPTVDASSFAVATSAPSIPTRLNDGPAPIPLCPPDVEVCDSLPLPQVAKTDGPAPIPLCPPDVEVCDSLPLPQIKVSFVA